MEAGPAAETAYAKINLALHVRRRRRDGFHEIETIFAFARDGDRLTAAPAGDGAVTLTIDAPFAAGLATDAGNLVVRAAEALRQAHGIAAGVRLHLDKRLPVASGIGGGSADAAAALRLLARMWDVAVPEDIAAALGADVPACVLSRSARAEGLGHPVHPIAGEALADLPLLLVNPGVPLGTGAVFAAWDRIDRGVLDLADGGDLLVAALAGRNDLEPPARTLRPEIDAVLAMLAAQPGVRLSRMSGSGATCFALFDTKEARDAAATIAAEQPGWWVMASALR